MLTLPARADVVILGGGHNALVAAAYLAREGLDVVVLERLDHVGGAAVSERPWPGLDARLSRYSYLVSLLPDALAADLGLRVQLRDRATASYTPYPGGGLLVESEEGEATRASFRALTGADDEYAAWRSLADGLGELAAAVAPTLLGPLPDVADVRDAVDPGIWEDVVLRPIGAAIERRFAHDLVRGVVATDALIGTFTSLFDPSLLANRCFLYHVVGNGTGRWRVPVGGMGAVTAELERVAREAGARLVTGADVHAVDAGGGGVAVVLADGRAIEAPHVLSGVAPSVLARLGVRDARGDVPPAPRGAQVKINLLVDRLPRLASGADPAVAFAGTFHVDEQLSRLEGAYAAAAAREPGAPWPVGELYCHTLTDRTILGPPLRDSGAQTLTYFGLHAPPETLTDAGAHERAWREVASALQAHLAEPLDDLLARDADGRPCVEVVLPSDLERELGMPGGHIFHGDLAWPWLDDGERAGSPAQRWGVATGHERVLVCGSGARRGGAVSGLGGHHAAHALLEMRE
ncbi:FAD-dependent pyridine nucleotide-disulphide oxidoreductase [Beutenbergia cavernae DSM 12333]|uniref:Pyridine nucleotide-disulfide oxidoreductase domain-containing protein 2 n=1 Tax=Beutenbergia cavernae (strain ATCC BAA-8 / DSM 12333 / CCUG 43141 / JCM 11478 / NBRC 16432 / NCIMB 13614 / HKI 0122) TaxID=471853 RepID=C5BVC1_BEUC1|nr:NAD(P)/FAD-dependent oxidoreductase [Beutenbergia cavernae]ACQ80508.1 FAD-dependent pyridine nucleotide-disulphide oxidoreductase [Beutenbergia cavernae DSM 12333]